MRKFLCLMMAVVAMTTLSWAQQTVTGKIVDDKGAPVPNVSIQVKGTTTGTVSNIDGTYSLSVPANGKTLVFSSVGMLTQEVSIGNKSSLNITLQNAADATLQEVVVVGYGATQRRGQVTSSISKVDPAPIATLVTPSVDKQLGGRAAGVQVTNPSGLVNQPPRIRIRGVNSISGNRDPLFVLDGVPVPSGGFSGVTSDNLLADINPADIESVEVLKDGAAAAIYGSRASNGVVLITTKKGRSATPRINYSGTFGFSQPSKRFDLLTGDQFVTIANEKMAAAGTAAQAFNPNHINTDWQDVIFRKTAQSQIHNLSVEANTGKTSYYLSFNYSNQEGLVITNAAKRYAIRANIEQRLNSWLKLSNYITLSRSEDFNQNNGGNSLSGAVYNAIRALPDVSPYDTANKKFSGYNITADGKALGMGNNTKLIDNNNTNIAYVLNKNKFQSTKHRIIDNLGLDLKPFSWLTFSSRANLDYTTLNDFEALNPLHGDGQSVGGDLFNQSANTLIWTLQNYFNFIKQVGSHNIAATVGTEYNDRTSNSYFGEGTGVADPFYMQQNLISNSYTNQFSGGSYSQGPSFLSYFGRASYDYKGKYFVQASFRRDGLSRFAPDKRWGNFPGVSVGYKISQEDFYANSSLSHIVNDLKLRASWARVGNQNIAGGNFAYLNLYGLAPYGGTSGIAASQVGNANLTWETSNKTDVGVDLGFLNDRITLTADYFSNRNNNLVLQALLPTSLGVPGNAIYRNIGDMKNKGLELSLNANIVQTHDLRWELGINYTNQSNKVLSLYQNKDQNVTAGSGATYAILRVGESLNALYGYRFAGVNPSNGNPMYYKADGTKIQGNVTDSKYYTVNADGTLGTQTTLAGADQTILGNSLVKWFGGITSSLSYKGFSLDMLWRYAGGNKIMNITRQESLLNMGFTNSGTEILSRWTKPGDVTSVPRVWYGRDNFINLTNNSTTRFIEDGDFIRLDNLQLSYGIGNSILNRISRGNIKSFRVFVQGQNLVLITKYKGLDPDNIGEQGADYNTVPSARTISFGLNVGF
ncbi:MAG: SusC/RagA family TonB-linked outer membrane protein [Flavisolibacter sp.]